jgi:hypothetical protein
MEAAAPSKVAEAPEREIPNRVAIIRLQVPGIEWHEGKELTPTDRMNKPAAF